MYNESSKSSLLNKEKIINQFFEGGEKLTSELLLKHGFELCWDGDYFKRREGDEKGYQTLRLSKRDDYFVSHLPTIKLYTLNDIKMLWFLRTREQLTEV